jgi:tetratricopeptide (TPR) repeat protein
LDSLNRQYNSTILFNRAVVYLRINQNAEALNDLNEAIKLNEEYTKAYIKRGDILLAQNQYEEAIRDFTKAKELDPCK